MILDRELAHKPGSNSPLLAPDRPNRVNGGYRDVDWSSCKLAQMYGRPGMDEYVRTTRKLAA